MKTCVKWTASLGAACGDENSEAVGSCSSIVISDSARKQGTRHFLQHLEKVCRQLSGLLHRSPKLRFGKVIKLLPRSCWDVDKSSLSAGIPSIRDTQLRLGVGNSEAVAKGC